MKTFQLDTTNIGNRRQLKDSLNELMGFNGWASHRLEEWVDLISVSDRKDGALARFASSKPQQIVLEVLNSKKFFKQHPDVFEQLVTVIQKINTQYMHKAGRPLMVTVLL